jgi:translation initiation factor IF-1
VNGDAIELTGVVTAMHGGDLHAIEVELGGKKCTVLAHRGGHLRLRKTRLTPGDLVTVELNAYDTTRGRITRRHDPEKETPR